MGNSVSSGASDAPKVLSAEEREEKQRAEQRRLITIAKPPGPGPPNGFKGVFTYANLERAEGEFKGGKLNGKGRFFSTKVGDSGWRVGTFVDNTLHGQGKAYDESHPGRVMKEGTFRHGKLHGQGRALLNLDGPWGRPCEATGHFENDSMTRGKVVYIDRKQSAPVSMEGTFHNSTQPRGKCTMVMRDGRREENIFDDEGDVQQGSFGIWRYPNGERWEGTFSYGQMSKGQRYDARGNPRDGDLWSSEWLPRAEYEKIKAKTDAYYAKKERKEKKREEQAKLARENGWSPNADLAKQAQIAAGWTAMQNNPANNWVAGGIGNTC